MLNIFHQRTWCINSASLLYLAHLFKTSLEALNDIGTSIQKRNRPPHSFEDGILLLLVEYNIKSM